ncbi:MAG: type VI secretion system membrane subunit TssM, partial [Pseudomonadota bacterium]
CDWWFTDEAVLLDTAGRFTTQDSDRTVDSAAWKSFLDLLKRHRREHPLNGIIVSVSVSDLLTLSAREREDQALAIRRRIDELYAHFGVRFPVYLMITKTDLLAGFVEYFDDLDRSGREQVWGFTQLPVDDAHTQSSQVLLDAFSAEIDNLRDRLSNKLLHRIEDQRDMRLRARVFGFPLQIDALKPVLTAFAQTAFKPTTYDDGAFLRGFYFTSGTQEGALIDRVMGSLSRAFGLSQSSAMTSSVQGRSYFIHDLLRKVIFPEADLTGLARKQRTRRQWVQRAAYAGVGVVTLVAFLAWSVSYFANMSYVGNIGEKLAVFAGDGKAITDEDPKLDTVLERLDRLRESRDLTAEHGDNIPISMGFGLYQGSGLSRELSDAYMRELNALFVPFLKNRLETQLLQARADNDFLFEALTTYLMLGNPEERLDRDHFRVWVTLDWQANQPDKLELLTRHLDALLDGDVAPVDLSDSLISRVRVRLDRTPLAELAYGSWKRDQLVNGDIGFRLTDHIGPDGASVFRRRSGEPLTEGIPELFTKRGLIETFLVGQKDIVERTRNESWVLGDEKTPAASRDVAEQIGTLSKDISRLYATDYITTWDRFLSDVAIVPLTNSEKAISVLLTATAPASPLAYLLEGVRDNTALASPEGRLRDAAGAAADEVIDRAGGRLERLLGKAKNAADARADDPSKQLTPQSRISKHFRELNALVGIEGASSGLDRIFARIDALRTELTSLSASSSVGGGIDVNPASAAGDIVRQIENDAAKLPQPISNWLRQLTSSSHGLRASNIRERIDTAWRSDMKSECEAMVAGRYPVYRAGQRGDITIRDFGRFFGSGGIVDSYFNTHLKSLVDTSQPAWTWKNVGNRSLGLDDKTLSQFRRARQIKETFFENGGQSPVISFGLKPVSLTDNASMFMIDFGDEQVVYRFGPIIEQTVSWPPANGNREVRIMFQDLEGKRPARSADGPWALFRILEGAAVEPITTDRIKVTFTIDEMTAVYEIRAHSVYNPFSLSSLRRFRCPEGLL